MVSKGFPLLSVCFVLGTIAFWQFNSNAQAPTSKWVGDGVADDTAAIQQVVESSTGAIVFPRGTYRLTKPIRIDLERIGWTSLRGDGVARFVMEAGGPAFQLIGTHDGTASPPTVKPNVWANQRSPMIDGIEIIGKHPDSVGIEADGTMQLTLSRLVIRKMKHAVHLVRRNRNVTLDQCHLYENSGVGVFLDGVNLHQINIANCHISYNAGGGIVARKSELRNLQIGTCDIEGNMGDDHSKPSANVWLDSSDASVGEVAIVGCTIQHSHNAPDSANIRINGLSVARKHTDERRCGNITIANNILSDVGTNLDLNHLRGVTITGNTMWKGYDANLIARDCSQMTMTGNVYDRSEWYHYGDGAKAKLGVLLEDCENVAMAAELYHGRVDHPATLTLRRCVGVNVTGCNFFAFNQVAVAVEDVIFSRVGGCLFRSKVDGAQAFSKAGDSDVNFSDNRILIIPAAPDAAKR